MPPKRTDKPAKQPSTKPAKAKAAPQAAAKAKAASKAKETIEGRATTIDDHLIQHTVTVKLITRTFPTSNVWVLHDQGEAVLIDAGFGDEPSSQVRADFLTKDLAHLRFSHIAITHHHFDHSSGARRLRDAIRAQVAINPIDEVLLHTPTDSNEDLPDEQDIAERAKVWREEALAAPIDLTLADGESVRVGGLTLRAVHTPGHTAGHNCYWVPERGALFTGDHVLGVGTSAVGPPPNGDMEQYLQSLLRMRQLQATLFAPGHGPVVTATDAKIQELIDHRAVRDRQIVDLIERGYTSDRQIRRAIYPEIQKGLRRAARGQVRSHLARLAGQGKVTVEQGDKEWTVALTR